MPKLYLTFLLLITSPLVWSQTRTFSLGVFTGIASSYTYDEGISKDQRYQNRYDLKFAPIGINYEIDFENVGFLLSPGITTVGQNFHVINTTGGHEGLRKINLQYLNVPIGCKFRIIDMSFFRVSFIGSVSGAYLLKGKETINHYDAKLKFPDEIVPPILPSAYIREYDGVLSPTVNTYQMLQRSNFKPIQFFVAVGFRSDWDVSESWRVSFDLRVNYGLLEPRTTSYLDKVSTYQTLYDIAGARRDMFVQLMVGASRFVDIEKKDREKKKQIKGSPKKYTPKRYPWPKPINAKSKH
jgi:hypothetical protein